MSYISYVKSGKRPTPAVGQVWRNFHGEDLVIVAITDDDHVLLSPVLPVPISALDGPFPAYVHAEPRKVPS